MFLDDTACNLQLNLTKFLEEPTARSTSTSTATATRRGCSSSRRRSWSTTRATRRSRSRRTATTTARSASATRTSARCSCSWASPTTPTRAGPSRALTAILTGHAYRTSAEMAATKGPFAGFAKNREPMLRVMGKHRDAAYAITASTRRGARPRSRGARGLGRGRRLGEQHGYRNAQATVLAPTGTIGLLMDCDTTGIEPDFALVKFKKLAGGGYFKIVNPRSSAPCATSGYSKAQIAEILAYVSGTNTFSGAPVVNRAVPEEKGLTDDDITKVEKALPGVFDLEHGLRPRGSSATRREAPRRRARGRATPGLPLLEQLGFTSKQIERRRPRHRPHDVEGAPHLRRSTSRSSTAPTAAASTASASSRRWRTCDDGRDAALPLGRDQQDRQPPQRRTVDEVATSTTRAGSSASRPSRSTATGARRRSRSRRRARRKKDDEGPRSSPKTEDRHTRGDCPVVTESPRVHAAASRGLGSPRVGPLPPAQEAPRLHPGGARRRATRSSSAPASTRTARSARSSSTCTRRAPPSAR
jgi:hypothetical protein